MNLLVIDLDGTITKSDNLISFSYYMIFNKKNIRFLIVFPLLVLLKIKLLSNERFKIWYSHLIIRNQRSSYLKECVQSFINTDAFQLSINNDVLKFIQEKQEYTKLILSANYSFIAENIAKQLNIETCLSINLKENGGKYTGYFSSDVPYGKGKINVLSSFIDCKKYNKSIGIGDSISDLHLLKYLNEGYLVIFNKRTNKTIFSKV